MRNAQKQTLPGMHLPGPTPITTATLARGAIAQMQAKQLARILLQIVNATGYADLAGTVRPYRYA